MGRVKYNYRISLITSIFSIPPADKYAKLMEKRLNDFTPGDTKLIKVTYNGCGGLYHDYDFIFENDHFQNGAEIKEKWTRAIYVAPDDYVGQYNQFYGFNYNDFVKTSIQ